MFVGLLRVGFEFLLDFGNLLGEFVFNKNLLEGIYIRLEKYI